jgi:hypothetical protein
MLLTFPLPWARMASASALFPAPPPCLAPITSVGFAASAGARASRSQSSACRSTSSARCAASVPARNYAGLLRWRHGCGSPGTYPADLLELLP